VPEKHLDEPTMILLWLRHQQTKNYNPMDEMSRRSRKFHPVIRPAVAVPRLTF
jgi:hypothetical protein